MIKPMLRFAFPTIIGSVLLALHAHAVLLHDMCMDCAEDAQSWLECFIDY